MDEPTKRYLIEAFKVFEPTAGYAGGCIKTRLDGYCYRIRPDGTIGKITKNCEHWETCKGEKADYNI